MYITLNLPPYLRITEAEAMRAEMLLVGSHRHHPVPPLMGQQKDDTDLLGDGNTSGFVRGALCVLLFCFYLFNLFKVGTIFSCLR